MTFSESVIPALNAHQTYAARYEYSFFPFIMTNALVSLLSPFHIWVTQKMQLADKELKALHYIVFLCLSVQAKLHYYYYMYHCTILMIS